MYVYDFTSLSKNRQEIMSNIVYEYQEKLNDKIDENQQLIFSQEPITQSERCDAALAYSKIFLSAFDAIDELIRDDKIDIENRLGNSKTDKIFRAYLGLDVAKSMYYKDLNRLHHVHIIDDSDYKMLNKSSNIERPIKKLKDRMLFSFIKMKLGDRLVDYEEKLNESIENDNFDEMFNMVAKSIGIKINAESFKRQFSMKLKIYKAKETLKNMFPFLNTNKNKALPEGNDEEVIEEETSVSANKMFVKSLSVDLHESPNINFDIKNEPFDIKNEPKEQKEVR